MPFNIWNQMTKTVLGFLRIIFLTTSNWLCFYGWFIWILAGKSSTLLLGLSLFLVIFSLCSIEINLIWCLNFPMRDWKHHWDKTSFIVGSFGVFHYWYKFVILSKKARNFSKSFVCVFLPDNGIFTWRNYSIKLENEKNKYTSSLLY